LPIILNELLVEITETYKGLDILYNRRIFLGLDYSDFFWVYFDIIYINNIAQEFRTLDFEFVFLDIYL
jgi:hypothetical protein